MTHTTRSKSQPNAPDTSTRSPGLLSIEGRADWVVRSVSGNAAEGPHTDLRYTFAVMQGSTYGPEACLSPDYSPVYAG